MTRYLNALKKDLVATIGSGKGTRYVMRDIGTAGLEPCPEPGSDCKDKGYTDGML